ncbi:MAG TPA: hypothetical protein VIG99_06330 [Myxococcaceae bacterium]
MLQFAPYAEQAFWSTPPEIRGQIRRRLEEIADVAGHLVSTVADSVGNTLRLEMSGHIISYVLSDVERTLTVVSVVSFAAQGRAANG